MKTAKSCGFLGGGEYRSDYWLPDSIPDGVIGIFH
jgi:hypothetical protein